jgi:uncharacterized protein YfbU (UPF0304 family)
MAENLTEVERQILANQFRILSHLDTSGENYEVSAEIMERGLTGQYHSAMTVSREEKSSEMCNETSEILNMYRRINHTIAKLSAEEREELDLEKIKFDGFDANNDDHYRYMKFLVEKMDLWQEHKDSYINSHSIFSLSRYRKMLEYQIQLDNPNNIDIEDLKKYIDAV